MFGPYIHEQCGLVILNPLIQLLSIEFFANDHVLVAQCLFDDIFEFQVLGTYFPNGSHCDYIVDIILNIPSFPIEFFIGDFSVSFSTFDIKNCHPHFSNSIQHFLNSQSLFDVYCINNPYGTQTSFFQLVISYRLHML